MFFKGDRMPENVLALYNTLDYAAQQEVCDFILFLVQKHEKAEIQLQDEMRKKNRQMVLSALSGIMKETWKEIAPLQYQAQLREERNIE